VLLGLVDRSDGAPIARGDRKLPKSDGKFMVDRAVDERGSAAVARKRKVGDRHGDTLPAGRSA
jgi:hypothetical protein